MFAATKSGSARSQSGSELPTVVHDQMANAYRTLEAPVVSSTMSFGANLG